MTTCTRSMQDQARSNHSMERQGGHKVPPPPTETYGQLKAAGRRKSVFLKNNCYQQANNTLVKGHAFMNVWAAQVVCHRRQNKRVYRVREGGRPGAWMWEELGRGSIWSKLIRWYYQRTNEKNVIFLKSEKYFKMIIVSIHFMYTLGVTTSAYPFDINFTFQRY